jgi:hypothetical protein
MVSLGKANLAQIAKSLTGGAERQLVRDQGNRRMHCVETMF